MIETRSVADLDGTRAMSGDRPIPEPGRPRNGRLFPDLPVVPGKSLTLLVSDPFRGRRQRVIASPDRNARC